VIILLDSPITNNGDGIGDLTMAKLVIIMPPTGAKKARTEETWERDHQLMLDAVGTQREWGRTAVKRLVNDAETLGIVVEVKTQT